MIRRRYKIKKMKTPPPVSKILMVTFILFIILMFTSIQIINKGIQPTLMEIAEIKTTEFATRGINAAVKFAEEYTVEDLTKTTTDNEGNVSFIGRSEERRVGKERRCKRRTIENIK